MAPLQHTPGPYRADGPDPFGDYNILHPADYSAVAAVVSNCRPAPEVHATALLFGATHDLLEALLAQEKADEALTADVPDDFEVWQRLETEAKRLRQVALEKAGVR